MKTEPADLKIFQIAQQVTDEQFGAGTYVRLNHFDPSKGETRETYELAAWRKSMEDATVELDKKDIVRIRVQAEIETRGGHKHHGTVTLAKNPGQFMLLDEAEATLTDLPLRPDPWLIAPRDVIEIKPYDDGVNPGWTFRFHPCHHLVWTPIDPTGQPPHICSECLGTYLIQHRESWKEQVVGEINAASH